MLMFTKLCRICSIAAFFLIPFCISAQNQDLDTPGAVVFTPPKDWGMADTKDLPKSVKAMVVGKGNQMFPPSMNLATERYNGTLKQYLKIVKSINDAKGADWKDLGTIKTEAGNASLSQVDSKAPQGDVRMMHVILVQNGTAYILTAAALKDEFPTFYKDFFNALRSFKINKDEFEMVSNTKKRAELVKTIDQLKTNWNSFLEKNKPSQNNTEEASTQSLFTAQEFQEQYWKPFQAMLEKDYGDMSQSWKDYVLAKLQHDFTQTDKKM